MEGAKFEDPKILSSLQYFAHIRRVKFFDFFDYCKGTVLIEVVTGFEMFLDWQESVRIVGVYSMSVLVNSLMERPF